jgi:hypothetical protein
LNGREEEEEVARQLRIEESRERDMRLRRYLDILKEQVLKW